MVRDDLYITVPNLFRCPISLDVMKSPVSLSTGVTYDRSSIQRWLDNGNNTCPATMQVLQSKEFIPNRTLHRLIQIWFDSARNRRVGRDDSSAVNSVPSQDQVPDLIKNIETRTESDSRVSESLSKIICFARESDENRKFLATTNGFVATLVEFLGNAGDGAGRTRSLDSLEQVVRVLDLVLNKNEEHKELANSMLKKPYRDCLASLLLILQQGKMDSRIASARVLETISNDAESKLLIAEKEGLLPELLKLIAPENDPTLVEAGLSCLIRISMAKRVKTRLVHLSTIKKLTKLLSEPNPSVSVTEKVLKLLETVSSCKEGRAEICEDSNCVAAIVQKVLKVSSTATEHAVTILWSVCYLFRDQTAQDAVAKANGLTKILLLMQSNCSPSVRQMSADLLKIFRVNSKSCLSSYDTKTTHIMPF